MGGANVRPFLALQLVLFYYCLWGVPYVVLELAVSKLKVPYLLYYLWPQIERYLYV